jgi:hypothetical protein
MRVEFMQQTTEITIYKMLFPKVSLVYWPLASLLLSLYIVLAFALFSALFSLLQISVDSFWALTPVVLCIVAVIGCGQSYEVHFASEISRRLAFGIAFVTAEILVVATWGSIFSVGDDYAVLALGLILPPLVLSGFIYQGLRFGSVCRKRHAELRARYRAP